MNGKSKVNRRRTNVTLERYKNSDKFESIPVGEYFLVGTKLFRRIDEVRDATEETKLNAVSILDADPETGPTLRYFPPDASITFVSAITINVME